MGYDFVYRFISFTHAGSVVGAGRTRRGPVLSDVLNLPSAISALKTRVGQGAEEGGLAVCRTAPTVDAEADARVTEASHSTEASPWSGAVGRLLVATSIIGILVLLLASQERGLNHSWTTHRYSQVMGEPKAAHRIAGTVVGPDDFAAPLPGHEIVSPFGLRQLPWEQHARLHAGVDIVAPMGTPVQAVAAGVIKDMGVQRGYGQYVSIAHAAGVTSFYAHLGVLTKDLHVGAPIARGQVIGQVGITGSSTGAHLHFELRNQAHVPMNPAYFLGRHFARIEDWPLILATHVSPEVRIAYVTNVPSQFRELMIAQEEAEGGMLDPSPAPKATASSPADAPVVIPVVPQTEAAAAVTVVAIPVPTVQEAQTLSAVVAVQEAPRRPAARPRLAMPD